MTIITIKHSTIKCKTRTYILVGKLYFFLCDKMYAGVHIHYNAHNLYTKYTLTLTSSHADDINMVPTTTTMFVVM